MTGRGPRRLQAFAFTFIALAFAAEQAAAQSWSKQILNGTARFKVLPQFGSDAVLDKETGLVWEREPSSSATDWDSGAIRCHTLLLGNRRGWRAASVEELASLVDPSNSNPALANSHPFLNVQNAEYWSATTFPLNDGDVTYARTVHFGTGGVDWEQKTATIPVWCVRSGQGVDGGQASP
jgi:hypothetical protein